MNKLHHVKIVSRGERGEERGERGEGARRSALGL